MKPDYDPECCDFCHRSPWNPPLEIKWYIYDGRQVLAICAECIEDEEIKQGMIEAE